MSEGIAHEFNNALNVVSGNIELLQIALPDHGDVNTFGNQAMDSIERLKKLTNQLHAYARGGKYSAKNIHLNGFLTDTLPDISSKLHSDIILDTDLSESIPMIEADTDQLQMVLSAILTNASEASAGRIHITTSNYPLCHAGGPPYMDCRGGRIFSRDWQESKTFDKSYSFKISICNMHPETNSHILPDNITDVMISRSA